MRLHITVVHGGFDLDLWDLVNDEDTNVIHEWVSEEDPLDLIRAVRTIIGYIDADIQVTYDDDGSS